MASLSLKNLNKIYPNGVQAVFDFNMDIEDGEFIVLVGSSGCGKSTTLRMVAGLEDITSGQLIIGDKDVTKMPAKDRDIAMVFQNYALYPQMTVYQNMAFSLTLRKMNTDIIHDRVMAAAKLLGLVNQLNKKPNQLSGGQRQRVAVGRSIVREPKVFLFDEPLSNLDAKLRGQMRRELKLLHQTLGTTMIYVTHDQVEAMTMADRIVIMSEGYVQQIGTPQELYEKPANLYVAGFIGLPAMNFFDCKVENGHLVNEAINRKLSAEDAKILQPYEGKMIKVGVRPEDIIEGNAVEMKVRHCECLGQFTNVHGLVGEKKTIAKIMGWKTFEPKSILRLDFVDGNVHYFDTQTTMVIR